MTDTDTDTTVDVDVDVDVVRYVVSDAVATLTLNSPANRNALSVALVRALEAGLAAAAQDENVRVVVLTHTGGTFCAGADLKEALALGMEQTSRRLVALLRAIVAHPKPVLAQLDGHVRAGGLGLVGACDIVVAGGTSTFAFTEARLGLAPAIISLVTSPRLTSRAAARYYLTGETFGAPEAVACGLVTTAADDPGAEVARLVQSLRACSPQGLEQSKRLTNAALLAGLDAGGDELAALSAGLFASAEAREGLAAFAERRPPVWAAPISATTSAPAPARLIGDLVERWATSTPDAPALTYEGQTWTWSQWSERIRGVAGALEAAGIGRGDRVAFLDKNHPACLEVTLAASSLGAANTVVNWRLAPDELAYVLTDSAPRIILVGGELVPALEAIRDRLTGVHEVIVVGGDGDTYERWLSAAAPSAPDPQVAPDDTALILYTSGTTGFPKGAMLTHRGLVTHTLACGTAFPMSASEGDQNLVAMPLFHVGGSCYALIGFSAGVPTHLVREVSGPALIGAVMGGATHAFLVPAVIAALVQAGPAAMQPMTRLKIIGYGASPAPLPVLRAAMAAWPHTDFLQVYGMTELSGVVTTLSPQAHRDLDRPERLASAGVPLPGVELRVVDPVTLDDVAAGARRRALVPHGPAHGGLPRPPRRDRRDAHRRRAGCAAGTSVGSTTAASCSSRTGSRTSSSPAARTSTGRRWSGCSSSIRRWRTSLSSASPTRRGASA